MKVKAVLVSMAFLFFLFQGKPVEENNNLKRIRLVDPKAHEEVKSLYSFFKRESGKHLLFGHNFTNTSGKGWKDPDAEKGRSDVKTAVGDFPAVFSYDFNQGFSDLIPEIRHAHQVGGIITISWHARNFATGKNFYDTSGHVMDRILPGGDLNEKFKSELDSIAVFANKISNGKNTIPVIFRPFHENTGSWFWWGAALCSPNTYKKVWHYTVQYLRDEKNVNNFLYAYSPSKPAQLQKESYEDRYPGNDFVDIIGFDYYGPDDYSSDLVENCRLVVDFAEKNNKIAAITETGVRKGIQNTDIEDWYMKCLLNPIKNDPIARKVCYVVTWTNGKSGWVPLPGDANHKGFVKFYEDEYTWFAQDIL